MQLRPQISHQLISRRINRPACACDGIADKPDGRRRSQTGTSEIPAHRAAVRNPCMKTSSKEAQRWTPMPAVGSTKR